MLHVPCETTTFPRYASENKDPQLLQSLKARKTKSNTALAVCRKIISTHELLGELPSKSTILLAASALAAGAAVEAAPGVALDRRCFFYPSPEVVVNSMGGVPYKLGNLWG